MKYKEERMQQRCKINEQNVRKTKRKKGRDKCKVMEKQ
jgi:hypothetical protein